MDEEVETEGTLTVTEFCKGQGDKQVPQEEEDEKDKQPPPSKAEVMQAFRVIARRVYREGLPSEALSQLENTLTKDILKIPHPKKISDTLNKLLCICKYIYVVL